MSQHPNTVSLKNFKGIDNVLKPEATNPSFLKKAENVDIDKAGALNKRKGYTKVASGNFSSIWASTAELGCYAVKDGNLVEVNSDYTFTTVLSNVGNFPISMDEIDDLIYFSSPVVNGIIDNGIYRSWGIPKNMLQPTLSITSGNLSSGTYQVSFTYVNKYGIEGGTVNSSYITVSNNSGISTFIPMPSDPDILYARVYCSTPDGTIQYYSGIGTLGSNYTISSVSSFSNPLRTQGLDNAPLGHIVKYYRGRMYIAADNILWYSEPFQYQHFNLASNYFEFPERIREVMPVEDGIWIGSDRLYYLSGDNPDEFKRSTKEYVKVVEGTGTRISGAYIHMDNVPIGYKWLVTTDLGIWILFNQGMLINLTAQNLSLEQADSGTSIFLQENGTNQYLSILNTNENPNNAIMGDLVEATIVRNGLTIP